MSRKKIKQKKKPTKSEASTPAMIDVLDCCPSLDTALPLYINVTRGTIEAIYRAVEGGEDLDEAVEGRSAAWVQAAYRELVRGEALADEWLSMEPEALEAVSLSGLDDFSLAVYSSVTMLRGDVDMDISNTALAAIMKNEGGSVLLNYEWLYRDMTEYEIYDTEEDLIALHQKALQHHLHYGDGSQTIDLLTDYVEDLFCCGRMEEGVKKLSCIVHADPFGFEVWDTVFRTLANLGHGRSAFRVMEQARLRAANADPVDRENFELSVQMTAKSLRGKALHEAPPAPWEEHLSELIDRIPSIVPGDMRGIFKEHLFSELFTVPIKRFAA